MKQQQQRVCETAKSGQERSIRFALAPIVYTLALGSLLCSSLSCCLPSSCCEEASCLAAWLAGQLNQPRRERESKAITSRRRRLAEVRSSRLGTSHFCKRLDRTRGFINVARPHINYGLRGNNDNQYRHDLIKQAANRYSSILTPNVLYKRQTAPQETTTDDGQVVTQVGQGNHHIHVHYRQWKFKTC